jgi:hypothetical protein
VGTKIGEIGSSWKVQRACQCWLIEEGIRFNLVLARLLKKHPGINLGVNNLSVNYSFFLKFDKWLTYLVLNFFYFNNWPGWPEYRPGGLFDPKTLNMLMIEKNEN